MNELIFRGKDRYRPSWSHLLLALAVIAAQGTLAAVKLGPTGTVWLVGGTIALMVPPACMTYRCWSSVGPGGITICWGLGRGRTYPWHEIQWLDVRTTKSQGSESRAARMFLTSGRRRTLPGLQYSDMYPDPDFEVDFRRVVNWWEFSTDAAARISPPKRLRDRFTPMVSAVIVTLLLTVGAGAYFTLTA
ncbi:hypothetical protein ACGFZP_14675 [Kitasatospora sp. NPDC048239]|uniref:hypothetical protein n=1 Tax=Kitasatospora sp. NPDC048239 TaxID=3364046 RepID=UPI00371E7FA8